MRFSAALFLLCLSLPLTEGLYYADDAVLAKDRFGFTVFSGVWLLATGNGGMTTNSRSNKKEPTGMCASLMIINLRNSFCCGKLFTHPSPPNSATSTADAPLWRVNWKCKQTNQTNTHGNWSRLAKESLASCLASECASSSRHVPPAIPAGLMVV